MRLLPGERALYTKCYELDEIRRVFKIECFQRDPEVFQRTHYSSNFLFKDPQFPETTMMENAMLEREWQYGLDERKRTGDFIRPYVIWGATGTGKTELCRFLELNIPLFNPDYETRRITKRELAMGGILGVAQVLSSLEIDFADRLLARHGDVGVEDVAVWALGNLIEQGKIAIQSGSKDEALRMCKTVIRQNVEERVKLVDSTEDLSKVGTALQFITRKDLTALSYYGIEMDIGKVNREIYRALARFVADVADIKRLIFDFIKNRNNSGKIPTLIFDDVTFLGDLVDDFIAVITDISGGEEGYVCDFVIGTTTEFYLSKFRDTLTSTVRERISEIRLSPEKREDMQDASWLLGENGAAHFLDFVLRYLDAARSCGGCSNCKRSPFVENGYNYHPFTKNFLVNFYNRMVREKEEPRRRGVVVSVTPRFVIQVLRNVLSSFVETSKLPSNFMDSSLTLNTTDFFDLEQEERDRLNEFLIALWWYGSHSENGKRVSLDMETIRQLGLMEQVPSHLRGKVNVDFNVKPLTRFVSDKRTLELRGPRAPDDVSLKANIRGWCKGEGSQIAVFPVVEGFVEVIKRLEESLSGSNSFGNIMNIRSSRKGEAIEFVPRGKRKHHFWVGSLKDDELQLYLMSKYAEESLRQYREKGFLILMLNEVDFFRLYKIGAGTTSEAEKIKYLSEFLRLRRDDVCDVLNRQRLKLKDQLEGQLGYPPECYVLSAYFFANKILKSQTTSVEIEDPDDIRQIMSLKIDLEVDDWPSDMRNLIAKMSKNFVMIDDLFHSFYSLRGNGSIIDYSLLEEAWLRIKNTPYRPLENIRQIDDHFILSKSKIKLKDFALDTKNLLSKIKAFSQTYSEDTIKKKIQDLHQFASQIADRKIIESLRILRKKLETGLETEAFELASITADLMNLEDPNKLLERLSLTETSMSTITDSVDKAVILITLHNIEKLPAIRVAKRLQRIIENLEDKARMAPELDLSNLRRQYLIFLEMKKVF